MTTISRVLASAKLEDDTAEALLRRETKKIKLKMDAGAAQAIKPSGTTTVEASLQI
jgi:hypothetical protein